MASGVCYAARWKMPLIVIGDDQTGVAPVQDVVKQLGASAVTEAVTMEAMET